MTQLSRMRICLKISTNDTVKSNAHLFKDQRMTQLSRMRICLKISTNDTVKSNAHLFKDINE